MGKLWLSRLQFSVMLKGTAAHQLSEPPGDQTEGPQAAGDTRKVQTFPSAVRNYSVLSYNDCNCRVMRSKQETNAAEIL